MYEMRTVKVFWTENHKETSTCVWRSFEIIQITWLIESFPLMMDSKVFFYRAWLVHTTMYNKRDSPTSSVPHWCTHPNSPDYWQLRLLWWHREPWQRCVWGAPVSSGPSGCWEIPPSQTDLHTYPVSNIIATLNSDFILLHNSYRDLWKCMYIHVHEQYI